MINSLRQLFSVARREWGEFFDSPIFYTTAALFHLLTGIFFIQLLVEMQQYSRDPILRSQLSGEFNVAEFVIMPTFDVANAMLVFLVPILTMRLVSEEKRSGLFELLATTPTSNLALIGGKFLGALGPIWLMAASAAVYPLMASRLLPPETGIVAGCMIGLFVMAAAYVAFGVFASTLVDSPTVAAVIALAGLLGFGFMGYIGPSDSSVWANALRGFSFSLRQREFFAGNLRGEDLLFFGMFTGFFLFASLQILGARRWQK